MARRRTKLAKTHWSYTVAEAADLYGCHRNTVRHWMGKGLEPIERVKPFLFHGSALNAFHADQRRRGKRPCQPGEIYCLPCHGTTGMGDGPVSMTGQIMGPFAGVFPLVGTTTIRSDGYIYNVIRIGNGGAPGFRMPSYHRVPPVDRWDLVNYVRYLDQKKGQP